MINGVLLRSIVRNFLLSLIVYFSHLAFAEGASETQEAIDQLDQQLTELDQIQRFVDRMDQGRVIVLINATNETKVAIENWGLVHTATLNQYLKQNLIYRSSTAYFSHVGTVATQPIIDHLYAIMDEIAQSRGLNDFTFNKMTYNTYSQIWSLLQDLIKMDVGEDLRNQVSSLTVEFGNLLAISKEKGDNLQSLKAGAEMFKKMEELYPLFVRFSVSSPAFDLILNIQGLNEFYAEYSGL